MTEAVLWFWLESALHSTALIQQVLSCACCQHQQPDAHRPKHAVHPGQLLLVSRCPPSVAGSCASEWAGADVELPCGSPAAAGAHPAAAFPPAGPLNPADPQAALLHAFLTTTAELRDRVRLCYFSQRHDVTSERCALPTRSSHAAQATCSEHASCLSACVTG